MLQYVSIPRKDLSRGLDTFSPKGSLADGYAEDLQNVDTNASGKLETRKGFEGYRGWVPFRITAVTHDGTTIRLQFSSAQTIDLSLSKLGSLVVFGHLSGAQSGDFSTTDVARWYPSFTLSSRVSLLASPVLGTLSQTAGQHGFSTSHLWVGLAEAPDPNSRDNLAAIPNSLTIDQTTYAVDLGYTVVADSPGFVYYKTVTAVAGQVHIEAVTQASVTFTADAGTNTLTSAAHGRLDADTVELTTTGTLPGGLVPLVQYYVVGATTNTFQLALTQGGTAIDLTDTGTGTHTWRARSVYISEATHSLDNFQILVKTYDSMVSAGDWTEVIPAGWVIDSLGGVRVHWGSDFTGNVYLAAAPTANIQTASASVMAGGPTLNTFTIAAPGAPFLFFNVYRFNSTLNQLESVIPHAWSYDEATDAVTIEYYLSGITGEPVEIYWTEGLAIANSIELIDTANVSANYTDLAPQLTVWGIDHAGTYRDPGAAGGHVTHLDSYKRPDETRLVCGLGGNLFRELAFDEGTGYSMGSAFVRGRTRAAAAYALAPLFWTTSPGSVRTRGVVYDASVLSNEAVVTAATLVSAGVVDYTLGFTNKTGAIAIGGVLSAQDKLTVRGLASPEHNGSWRISSVQSDSATQTVIRVANPSVLNATRNEAGARGRAGVFTDLVTTTTAPEFVVGDRLMSDAISTVLTTNIITVSGTTVYVDGVTATVSIPDGIRLFVSRTAQVVPLRDADDTPTITGFVRGDMLVVGDLGRRVRVIGTQAQASQTATFVGTGSVVTTTTPLVHYLNAGDRVLFTHGTITGETVVTSVPSTVTFTFASTLLAGSATLVGNCIVLDEALTLADSVAADSLQVDGRWAAIEAPPSLAAPFGPQAVAYDRPLTTHYRYLESQAYDAQPQLRSTIIADSMFFTNGEDEVFKFDGTYLQRAGLPRWQPTAFAANYTPATTAQLAVGNDVPYTAFDAAGRWFELDSAVGLAVGSRIYQVSQGLLLTIKSISFKNTTSKYLVEVLPTDVIAGIGAGAGTIRKVQVYRYYLRLNLVDRNQNVVPGPAIASEDLVVDYAAAGQIQLRLVGMPAFDAYDYDRIELEVYRTQANGQVFHLQSRRLVDFDRRDPYIDIYDALPDTELAPGTQPDSVNLDFVTSRLIPFPELGTGWEQPPRAKHITSAGNRLLLGNVRSYPQATLTLKPAIGGTAIAAADLAGKRLLFRRDSTDAGTATALADRVAFEFINTTTTITVTSATTTNFTVTWTGHAFVAGNWVYLHHFAAGGTNNLKWAGWWQVETANIPGNTFTVAFNSDGVVGANPPTSGVRATARADVPVWLGTDGNFNQRDGNPASAASVELQAATRLAMAINASMRASTQATTFEPWLAANAGNDYAPGQLVVTSPRAAAETPELVMPAATGGFQLFVNSLLRTTNEPVQFLELLFPSRLVRSYANYPELFDNPFAQDASESDSIIDVNPADGQEITAIVPHFGESATSTEGNPLQQAVVVFKTNSIYVVNPESRAVQRLDSRGLGCTAPRSVSVTQRGVMFANLSGVYRLNRDLSIDHVGRMLTGVWRTRLNRNALSEAYGHHYAVGRRYKLSIPVDGGDYPSEVVVYDHDREGATQQFGAWTRYTNHNAVGWCNQRDEAYWASTQGDVFLVRNREEASDYRDEAAPVAETVIRLRAEDFDLPQVRKACRWVSTQVELERTNLTGLSVETAPNLSTEFVAAGSVTFVQSERREATWRASPELGRGTYLQVQYRHQVKDQALVLTGVSYWVAQLTPKLTPQAADD